MQRLPADVVVPLGPGEAIAFEYGGFLNFKAGLNFGYEMSGAPAFSIGELALSQKLEFALGAKVDVGAKLVGNFRILVREGSEAGWARVTIRKSASRSLSIGATVDASAKIQTTPAPGGGVRHSPLLLDGDEPEGVRRPRAGPRTPMSCSPGFSACSRGAGSTSSIASPTSRSSRIWMHMSTTWPGPLSGARRASPSSN